MKKIVNYLCEEYDWMEGLMRLTLLLGLVDVLLTFILGWGQHCIISSVLTFFMLDQTMNF